jgi:hypothetical protein
LEQFLCLVRSDPDGLNRSRGRLFLGHFDRDLGTVALGEPGLVFQARGHGTIADFVRVAEFVEVEQFGCQ